MKAAIRRQQYGGSHSKLAIFGSSANGFGSRTSDLDISWILEGQEKMKPGLISDTIKSVASLLRKLPGCTEIQSVTNCKVPIVKLTVDGLQCDLSLYNQLALQNTKLLKKYSRIDERLRTLGFFIKAFAKMYADDIKPENLVEGWNTWFFQDEKVLATTWGQNGPNKQDESELWIGFLDFYSQKFDYKKKVVSIRTAQDVTKMEKLWNSDFLVIEDPFNTDHNLGKALTRKTNTRILSNLRIARDVFGNPPEPSQEEPMHDYYLRNKRFFKLPPGSTQRQR
ncbi:terminal uridylyltransferase 7-like [Watersipora subatra]|uniref:terminal uridylyltransferase 7-like n=1 Tax=Watersipora subatra TaxID=2589382 RepID=UPI00355C569B